MVPKGSYGPRTEAGKVRGFFDVRNSQVMLGSIQAVAMRFPSVRRAMHARSARHSRLAAVLAGVALLVTLTTTPGGLLLCVGPGAHIDLETPHNGSACHNPDGDLAIGQDCVDFSLQADFTDLRRAAFDSELSAGAFSVGLIATAPRTAPFPSISDAAPRASVLPARRTVVLLV